MDKEGGEEEQSLQLEGGGNDTLNQSIKKGKNVKFDEKDGGGSIKKTNDLTQLNSVAPAAAIPEAGTTMEFMRESLKDLKSRVNRINN